jgi:predicted extracellular nuclease
LLSLALLAIAGGAQAQVVISQAYGGGGNSGATYKNDFIEIFNAGTTSQDLTGWSVQYASTSGGTWQVTNLTGVTLQAGQYYLVQEAAGSGGTTNLPTPDATGSIAMSGTGFKVALVASTTALTGSAPASSSYVDLLGAGTATYYEGSGAAPAPSNTTADVRANGGCTDTNNNNADFSTGAPNPRNTATTLNVCSVSTNPTGTGSATPSFVPNDGTTPTTLSVDASPGAGATTITSVTVDLSPIGGASSIALNDSGDHEHFSLSGVTVSPATSFGTKTLTATLTDDQSQTGTANIALTVSATIMQVNGRGVTPALNGQTMTITGGVVTALVAKGFFMQDPNGDGDITTSDGTYVYLGSTPTVAVGHSVTVMGKVDQYDNYETEIDGTVVVTDNGVSATPVPVFNIDDYPPTDDYTTGICANAAITPLTDGYAATNYACLNDMLVSFSGATVVGAVGGSGGYNASNSQHGGGNEPDSPQYFYVTMASPREFREPGIIPGDPALTNPLFPTYTPGYAGPMFSGHPNIFQVYYQAFSGFNVSDLPDGGFGPGVYNVGQTIGITTGVLQQFAFATKIGSTYYPDGPVSYEIYPLTGSDVSVSGTGLTLPQPVADSATGTLTIGTQNGLHFFNGVNDGSDSSAYVDACLATEASVNISGNVGGTSKGGLGIPLEPGDNDTCPTENTGNPFDTTTQYGVRLAKMSLQVRTVLKAPSVQVLQEVENLSVLTDIANKIHADDPTLTYHPFLFKGNDPQGINIGILVKDDADLVVNSVSQLALSTPTSACSGGGSCLQNDRPPVLFDATYKGSPFRVLAIYDRSLGSLSSSTYVGPKRRAQAEQVARIVQTLQSDTGTLLNGSTGDGCSNRVDGTGASTSCADIAGNSTTPVVVIGDFNANEFSDGYVDVTGTIMGTVDTTSTQSVFPPTVGYSAPSPTLVNAVEATTDPAQNPLTWNPNYSYSYDGLSEEIDHILLTRAGWADFVRISHAHGNTDVSSASSDVSDPNTPRRLSDHDGQVVTLTFDRIFADGFGPQP